MAAISEFWNSLARNALSWCVSETAKVTFDAELHSTSQSSDQQEQMTQPATLVRCDRCIKRGGGGAVTLLRGQNVG
jgi:hypothetical protein